MLNISYTTYEDEYHFNFILYNTEMIFAIKDSNILKFLEFIKKSFSVPFKSYFEEDINNLKLYTNEVKYNNEIKNL